LIARKLASTLGLEIAVDDPTRGLVAFLRSKRHEDATKPICSLGGLIDRSRNWRTRFSERHSLRRMEAGI
jgi:hypothetical protein